MNIHVVTFSNYKYTDHQMNLKEYSKSLNLNTFTYTFDQLKTTSFYTENKTILDRERGSGFCLWKPHIILDALTQIPHGDVVFYIDCADIYTGEAIDVIKENMTSPSMLFLKGSFKNKMYTKRDTFYYMNCDSHHYWDEIQCEAGICAFKNTDESKDFISEWLGYCKDARIITDDPNVCGLPNLPEYVDHRYDQSVLSNLIIKHNKQYFPSILRCFVKCNVNDVK